MSWTTAPLGEVTQVLSGSTPDSGNTALWNGEHVWVTPTDLGKLNGMTISVSARRISDKALQERSLPLIKKNAVVMSSRAPIGHLAIAGCDLYTNQGCKSFVCGEDVDAEFLFFTLRHRMGDIQALGSGSTFMEVSKSALESFEIWFPRIDEQRRIAAHLKAQLAEVDTARQAAHAQVREAGLLRTKLVDAAFSACEQWRSIGSVAKVQSGYAFKSEDFTTSGIRLLRNTNILPGKVYWDDTVCIDASGGDHYPNYVLAAGDILISLDRPLISSGIKVARVSADDLPALLLQRVGRFVLVPDLVDPDFLFAYLQSSRFIAAISGHDQSVGVPHISPGQVEAVEFPLPSIDEQRHLVTLLQAQLAQADAIAQAAAAQLAEIERLPQRLLAQAFNPPSTSQGEVK